jgi:uncharacterized protein
MGAVLDRARSDARALATGAVDAILVENYGDTPFCAGPVPPETVAALTAAVMAVQEAATVPVGVNVLRNDAAAALAIATATGCTFIRVNVHTGGMYTDQGWIEGDAAGTLRARARLDARVAILADVLVKHATAPAGLNLERAARDAWERGWADGLIVSGEGTGEETPLDDVRTVRRVVPGAPVLVGSGVTAHTIAGVLAVADGAIVGTALQEPAGPGAGVTAGRAVDPPRVRQLMDAAAEARRGRP